MKSLITLRKQSASFKIAGLMLTIAPLWLMLAAGDTAAYAQTPDKVECPGSWKLVSTSGPQERNRIALAYDSARRQVVLFGGTDTGSNRMGDTWTWDGTMWIHSADTGPSPRSTNSQMDFDTDQKRVVLFGGQGTTGNPNQDNGDTWEWNGTTWTQVAATGPPARNAGALAYDSGRHLSVLYGGGVTFVGLIFHDTWELQGNAWKQRFPLAGVTPGSRGVFGLAYDSSRARTVLFGGQDVNGGTLGDTWEWGGISWKQVASTGPSNRAYPAMAYDSARHRVVEFGGATANGLTFFGDTWEWNGVDWTQVATTGPGPRSQLGIAYDSERGKTVIFGGVTPQGALLQETWEWTGPIYSCTGRIAGDLNCDGRVDNDDLTILNASLNEAACSVSDPRDLNHDGQITAEDAQALVGLCTELGCQNEDHATLTLSTNNLNFGSAAVNTASDVRSVTLTNTGTAVLDFNSIDIFGAVSPDGWRTMYATSNSCVSTLAVNASCVIKVRFSPLSAGSVSGTLIIESNASNGQQDISLFGAGAAPSISLSQNRVEFGNQAVGTSSAVQQVTLTNTDTVSVNISGIWWNGAPAGTFAVSSTCGATLAPSTACLVKMRFNPQATGIVRSSVYITNSATTTPLLIGMAGTGVAAATTGTDR